MSLSLFDLTGRSDQLKPSKSGFNAQGYQLHIKGHIQYSTLQTAYIHASCIPPLIKTLCFKSVSHIFLVCAALVYAFTPIFTLCSLSLLNPSNLSECTSTYHSHSCVSADTVASGCLTPGVGSVFFPDQHGKRRARGKLKASLVPLSQLGRTSGDLWRSKHWQGA